MFLGLSAAGALKPDMVKTMAKEPIIFAMANPDPEIWPPDAMAARPDAIIATGRSDFPNQVNNVLGFPFIFRGALDVRATAINDAMKIAAAEALAELAREPVPEEVAAAYGGRAHSFGRDYIIPAPFDPRLMEVVAVGGRRSGGPERRRAEADRQHGGYRQELRGRLNPTVAVMSLAYENARQNPKRVLFAEGEEPNVLRAAIAFKEAGYGTPVLVGREEVYDLLKEMGVDDPQANIEVLNSRNSPLVGRAVDYIYAKHQRHGMLRREVERLVNQDRNYFAAAMLALGEADAMITGTTRPVQPVAAAGPAGDRRRAGRDAVRHQRRRRPQPYGADRRHRRDRAADRRAICGDCDALVGVRPAHGARAAGRVHQLHDLRQPARHAHRGAARRRRRCSTGFKADFEYEGEMAPDVALNYEMQKRYYPFTPPVRPGQHPGHAGAAVGEPVGQAAARARRRKRARALLLGLEHPVQIAPMTASASDLVMLAVLAGGDAHARQQRQTARR